MCAEDSNNVQAMQTVMLPKSEAATNGEMVTVAAAATKGWSNLGEDGIKSFLTRPNIQSHPTLSPFKAIKSTFKEERKC